MNEENIHVDTLVTEDMNKKELYDYAKYLEYRKEELLNINYNLQQRVEQLENIRKEAVEYVKEHARIDDEYPAYIEMLLEEKQDLLNILNKGSDKE